MNEHKSIVYRLQSLILHWDPMPRFVGFLLLANFLLLWVGSWLASWSLLTACALYGLGYLTLATFPITMPIYDSSAPLPDNINPEKQAARDRGLKTIAELAEQADRAFHVALSYVNLFTAFARANRLRFFLEASSILVLVALLGTKLGTPRLLCLLRTPLTWTDRRSCCSVNAALLYPGLARRGLIDQWVAKVPADKRKQVQQLAERLLDTRTDLNCVVWCNSLASVSAHLKTN